MTETYVSYAPGDWTLLARGGRYLLVEAALGHGAIGRLWTSLEAPDSSAEVLADLGSAVPGARFCLVEVAEDGVRVAQDGIAAVLDGRPVPAGASPSEVPVPASGGMIIAATGPGAGALQVPIESGVVAAGAVIVVQVGAVEERVTAIVEPEPAQTSEPEPDPEPVPATDTLTQLWDDVPELDASAVGGPPVELAAPVPVATAVVDPAGPVLAPPPQPYPAGGPPPTGDPDDGRETVLAGICLHGHWSGANAPSCRVCGDPMPPQSPRTIPRPRLGVLVLQDGTTVDLNRGAILGRAPHVPEESGEQPHLVNLAAYGRDISRQHAEVIVRGWSVFVRDLGSANGTRVHDASGEVTTLEPGVAVPLQPESLIDVSEVTSIRYRTS